MYAIRLGQMTKNQGGKKDHKYRHMGALELKGL